jgi:hypothetical protein
LELDVEGAGAEARGRGVGDGAGQAGKKRRAAGFHFRTESGLLANTDGGVHGRRNVGMKDHCFDAGGRKSGGAEFLTDLPSIGIQERVAGEEVRRTSWKKALTA